MMNTVRFGQLTLQPNETGLRKVVGDTGYEAMKAKAQELVPAFNALSAGGITVDVFGRPGDVSLGYLAYHSSDEDNLLDIGRGTTDDFKNPAGFMVKALAGGIHALMVHSTMPKGDEKRHRWC